MRIVMHVAVGILAFIGVFVGDANAQSRCRPTAPPVVEYIVEVPRGGPSEGFVRHQLVSEYCPNENRDRAYTRYKVLDERGRVLATSSATIVPLSARHAVVGVGMGAAILVYGQQPGEAIPYELPSIDQIMQPGAPASVPEDRAIVVEPIVIASPRVAQGASTAVSVALFSGYSQAPRIIEGLGGRAVFGADTFGPTAPDGRSITRTRIGDYVMPQIASLIVQNMTAPDGTGAAFLLDGTGEPVGPAMGLVDLVRVPERDYGPDTGLNSRTVQLVSRMAPLGPGFPGRWLYMPIDRYGTPQEPLPGSVGYTLLRPADRNDRPVWAVVYRGAKGFEVSLPRHYNGRLPLDVLPQRYSALQIRDVRDDLDSFAIVGQSPSTGQWSVVQFHLYSPPTSPNVFATPQAAFAAQLQWRAAATADVQRLNAEWAAKDRAARARDAEAARAAAISSFEADLSARRLCYPSRIAAVTVLGDDYLRRWLEACGVPIDMTSIARRLKVSQAAFDRGVAQAQALAARDAELRAMGARNNGFAESMAAYRTRAGAAASDPWVAVRVTEGGRTITQMMRQSEYDRRRP